MQYGSPRPIRAGRQRGHHVDCIAAADQPASFCFRGNPLSSFSLSYAHFTSSPQPTTSVSPLPSPLSFPSPFPSHGAMPFHFTLGFPSSDVFLTRRLSLSSSLFPLFQRSAACSIQQRMNRGGPSMMLYTRSQARNCPGLSLRGDPELADTILNLTETYPPPLFAAAVALRLNESLPPLLSCIIATWPQLCRSYMAYHAPSTSIIAVRKSPLPIHSLR